MSAALAVAFALAVSNGHQPAQPVHAQWGRVPAQYGGLVDPQARLIIVPRRQTRAEACATIAASIRFLDTGRWGDVGEPRRCWTRWERKHLRPDPFPR